MSGFIPSVAWSWHESAGYLTLSMAGQLHTTRFAITDLHTVPAYMPFTLEQAELYQQFNQSLECLGWSETNHQAAAIDALAAHCFLRQTAHKSWWFTNVSLHCIPKVAQLVFLHCQQTLLGIVVQQYQQSASVLLLESGHNLQGKPLQAGQVVAVLADRLQPWSAKRLPHLAKTA